MITKDELLERLSKFDSLHDELKQLIGDAFIQFIELKQKYSDWGRYPGTHFQLDRWYLLDENTLGVSWSQYIGCGETEYGTFELDMGYICDENAFTDLEEELSLKQLESERAVAQKKKEQAANAERYEKDLYCKLKKKYGDE